jgi:hypothetical protein
MKPIKTLSAIFFASLFLTQTKAFAQLSRADFGLVATAIRQDFQEIEQIRTIEMDGDRTRYDVVVVGGTGKRWRVEVFSAQRHKVRKIWDSAILEKDLEFGNSNVMIDKNDTGYKLVIKGCALHQCSDGIFGFLVYDGKSGRYYKAKVTTIESSGGRDHSGNNSYSVIYSPKISGADIADLQKMICATDMNEISNKAGLPFECK